MKHNKQTLRELIKQKRSKIPKIEKRRLDDLIFNNVINLPNIQCAKIIATYVSKDDEVDTHKLINYFLANNNEVLVPYVEGEELSFTKIRDLEKDLELGCFGVLEPKRKEPINVYKANAIIVPGIAFDEEGYRIGYGGGYFDRVLRKFEKPKIGLAYEIQIVDEVPREEHDVPVDIIVTEKRIVECKKSVRKIH